MTYGLFQQTPEESEDVACSVKGPRVASTDLQVRHRWTREEVQGESLGRCTGPGNHRRECRGM